MIDPPFLQKIEKYRKKIDLELATLVDNSLPEYLRKPLRYVIQGRGKRLRPILLLIVSDIYDISTNNRKAAALAVELLHNFSLVHDDIMDNDEFRHGLPTVFKKFDVSTAVLVGDALFALASREIEKISTGKEKCFYAFNEAVMNLCIGQALDKEFESRKALATHEWERMIKLKTGALISFSSILGGLISDAATSDIKNLKMFGLSLGMAFQIQDDYLEIFSNPETMGKSLGSDILLSKKTFLTSRITREDKPEWERLLKSIVGKELLKVGLPRMRNFFVEKKIDTQCQKAVKNFLQQANDFLHKLSCQSDDLYSFVDLVMNRRN